MPPRRVVRDCPARRNVKEQGLPNAPEVQPQGKVTNIEFREAIRMLSQVVTNQVGQQRGVQQEEADTSKIHKFLRMNPPCFTGSSTNEDQEYFMEELQKIFEVMYVVDTERVEIVAYQMKGVARIWFDQLKKNRAEDAPLVHEYGLKFTQLSRYAPEMVANMRIRINLFVEEQKLRDREEFKNKRAKIGNESRQQKSNSNRSSFQQKRMGPAPSSASAPAPKNKSEYNNQNFRAIPFYSQGSMAQGGSKSPACAKCSRNHLGTCREGSTGCFKFFISCSTRATPIEATSGTGEGSNRLYAITSRQEQKDLPDVVTRYDLNPGASSSIVTPYVAMNFDIIPEQLTELFSVLHLLVSLF
ncbi:hypothetical protein H5410_028255 [Solanum commersonii]|uniref:Gag-pol polyprotein n=1 Tax=Solanum commersonii TaxID=4109 RepID=A0A9J5Z1E3_SOLCO|nr:hypothetical protein H5410_028255 [Solanum commersonii]